MRNALDNFQIMPNFTKNAMPWTIAVLLLMLSIGNYLVEAQTDATVKDYAKWELPKEAKARLGKGGINAMQFSPDGTRTRSGQQYRGLVL